MLTGSKSARTGAIVLDVDADCPCWRKHDVFGRDADICGFGDRPRKTVALRLAEADLLRTDSDPNAAAATNQTLGRHLPLVAAVEADGARPGDPARQQVRHAEEPRHER